MKKTKKLAEIPITRVACYCRVSTENQIENYSIDEQQARLKAFCAARGWSNLRMFIDPGFSGGNIKRPALSSLIECVQDGKIDIVCVYKLDRLSRSQKDTLYLIEDVFNKNGVDFVSVCENFDTSTPFGKAMVGILSVFAQLEKDQITERFTMGRIGRAKSGLYHGGANPPTGYDYIDGKLVMNDYEAMQVREVFERFNKGESIHSITKTMKSKYSGWSVPTTVLRTLQNSTYIGKVKYGGIEYDGKHQPIISNELFYKTQTLLDQREKSETERQKNPFRACFLLSGLVYCGNCGARYHGNGGYYKCYSRAKNSKRYIIDPNCKNPNIKIEMLDDIVKKEIRNAALNPERIINMKSDSAENFDEKSAIESKLTETKRQLEKLLDIFQFTNATSESVIQRLNALETEKETLEEQLKSVPPIRVNQTDDFLKTLSECDDILDIAPIDEQRMFVTSLVRKIIVNPDYSVNVDWRVLK